MRTRWDHEARLWGVMTWRRGIPWDQAVRSLWTMALKEPWSNTGHGHSSWFSDWDSLKETVTGSTDSPKHCLLTKEQASFQWELVEVKIEFSSPKSQIPLFCSQSYSRSNMDCRLPCAQRTLFFLRICTVEGQGCLSSGCWVELFGCSPDLCGQETPMPMCGEI